VLVDDLEKLLVEVCVAVKLFEVEGHFGRLPENAFRFAAR
jgi:hypothetical protein